MTRMSIQDDRIYVMAQPVAAQPIAAFQVAIERVYGADQVGSSGMALAMSDVLTALGFTIMALPPATPPDTAFVDPALAQPSTTGS